MKNRKMVLGNDFRQKVRGHLEKIPHLYPIKRNNYREAVVQKFPYVIVFEIVDSTVIVYPVFYTSQNSAKKP